MDLNAKNGCKIELYIYILTAKNDKFIQFTWIKYNNGSTMQNKVLPTGIYTLLDSICIFVAVNS